MGKIKIMHLSDLHIGIKLMNYDLKEEQQYVFQQIIEYAKEERPDAVLIAGDIYDKSIPEMCRKRKQPDKCSRTGIFRHGRRTQTIR